MKKIDENLRLITALILFSVTGQGCDNSDDCTRIDRIGGGLLPEQEIEVPCDFPGAEPLGGIQSSNKGLIK